MPELPKYEIVLVEDNENDVELVLRALKKFNFDAKTLVLQDGTEALKYFFGSGGHEADAPSPKVIFLDLKLPKVDGLEVLRRLKEDVRTQKIPVVVLTSSTESRDMDECYRLGVNSFIIKPVDFNKFMQAVSEAGFYWVNLNRFPY